MIRRVFGKAILCLWEGRGDGSSCGLRATADKEVFEGLL